jgi:7-cyano-7-deazaguanine synthase
VSGLFVDYGQLASTKEDSAAVAICRHYGIPLQRLTVTGYENLSGGYVLGRNAFLLHAALMAFSHSAGIIALGIHSGTRYVDCTEDFLRHMQALFDLYADGRIRVDAPFLHWNKREIWEFCREAGVPVGLTYSCENGLVQPCGECASCLDLEALYAG